MGDDVGIWKSELRRGLVELCVLLVLRKGEAYGYEIVERLRDVAGLDFTESTVYPVPSRITIILINILTRLGSVIPLSRTISLTPFKAPPTSNCSTD